MPFLLWRYHLLGHIEQPIELPVARLRRRGLADLEHPSVIGRQDDGRDPVGLELFPDCRKAGVLPLVSENLFYSHQQVIRQHAQKNVGVHPVGQLMKYRSFRQRAFHGPKSILGTCQEIVYPPTLLGSKVRAVGFEQIRAVESNGLVILFGGELSRKCLGTSVICYVIVPGHPGIPLFEAAYCLPNLPGLDQSPIGEPPCKLIQIRHEALLLLLLIALSSWVRPSLSHNTCVSS